MILDRSFRQMSMIIIVERYFEKKKEEINSKRTWIEIVLH